MKLVDYGWFKLRYAKKIAMSWFSFLLIVGFTFAAISSCQNSSPKEKGMVTLWPNGAFTKYEHNPNLQGEAEAWKTRVGVAYSEDLIHWREPLHEPIMRPRSGYFDSKGTEPGAAVVLEEGILLIYNGWNEELVHKTGWALFSKEEPTEILARCEEPILESTEDWEGHILFTESIVEYQGTWYLHYGIMDKVIGVATYEGAIDFGKDVE